MESDGRTVEFHVKLMIGVFDSLVTGILGQSWTSDFCVKILKILSVWMCQRTCYLSQHSLKMNHCVECVRMHECSLLTKQLCQQFISD